MIYAMMKHQIIIVNMLKLFYVAFVLLNKLQIIKYAQNVEKCLQNQKEEKNFGKEERDVEIHYLWEQGIPINIRG